MVTGIREVVSRIPSYLRLHTEESTARTPHDAARLGALCESLQALSGRRIVGESQGDRTTLALLPLEPPLDASLEGDTVSRRATTAEASVPPATGAGNGAIESLVTTLNDLFAELHRTRRALTEREAELAAGVPVATRADEPQHLAERLEAILRGAARTCGGSAAALYLLDEATSRLKLRSAWGLPAERLLESARPLRGAVADLEALLGHAIVIEDARRATPWKAPEPCGAAVCLPVSSPTNPLGTLWVFADEPRDFTEHETETLEIIAGRLAAELEREVLLDEGLSGRRLRREREQVATTMSERLPRAAPIVDGWELAGWSLPHAEVGREFFDWNVLPDGRLTLAIGDVQGEGMLAALGIHSLQTAMRAHAGYRHDAQQMLSRLNDTLWSSSTGDFLASLFYALIDPDTGQLQYSGAGETLALLSGQSVATLRPASLPLGTRPEETYRLSRDHIMPGGLMMMVSRGLRRLAIGEGSGKGKGGPRSPLMRLIARHNSRSAQQIADAVRALALDRLGRTARDLTVVVAKRR